MNEVATGLRSVVCVLRLKPEKKHFKEATTTIFSANTGYFEFLKFFLRKKGT